MKPSNYLISFSLGICFLFTSFFTFAQCSDVLLVIATGEFSTDISWTITDANGNALAAGNGYQPNSATTEIICLEDGCYSFNMYSATGWNGSIATLLLGEEILGIGFGNGAEDSFMFGVNEEGCTSPLPFGCVDQEACNFDPNATIDDGSCTYPGCMDASAINYDPEAGCPGECDYEGDCPFDQWLVVEMFDTFGDGWNGALYTLSALDGDVLYEGTLDQGTYDLDTLCVDNGCYVLEISGGSFPSEIEWSISNSSGLYLSGGAPTVVSFGFNSDDCPETIFGCTDPEACEYDETATDDDGSCVYSGCLDPNALNYNPYAGCDGECEYPEPCDGATVHITLIGFSESPAVVLITNSDGEPILELEASWLEPTVYEMLCLGDDCYSVVLSQPGPGPNEYAQLGIDIDLESDGIIDESYYQYAIYPEPAVEFDFGINADDCGPIYGCTDPTACNYNPEANLEDYTCTYPGCTDSTAWNYEYWAGCDDGSCEYLECEEPVFLAWYVSILDSSMPVWWYVSDSDGDVVLDGELDFEDWNWVEPVCLDDGCYTFTFATEPADSSNTWVSLSVDLDGDQYYDLFFDGEIGNSGEVSFEFGINDSCTEPCELTEVAVEMFDTFGDGWNGAQYVITGEDGVVYSGSLGTGTYGIDYLCLPDGCYLISVGGGTFDSEIEWTVSAGDELLAFGGAPSLGVFGINSECDLIVGCTDPEACEYNADAELDDGSCTYPGCTDPEALNYDPSAGCDDESCEYPEVCEGVEALLYVCTFGNGENVELDILDSEGNIVIEVNDLPSVTISYYDLCLDPDECYTVNMYNTEETGWYGGYFWITVDGITIVTEELDYNLAEESVTFSINNTCPEPGCTDPEAINYNPYATEDDGSCIYGPDNDLCADAEPLEPGTYLISNVGAYLNEGFDGDCWGFGAGEEEQTSIWFSFTTPDEPANIILETWGDGTYTLTDTQFGLYLTCEDEEATACDGNSGDGLFAMFNFQCGDLEPATTYLLQIDGWSSDSGTCMLTYEVNDCDAYVEGCTDPYACNFNPDATVEDWTCTYPGCTDPEAWNYQEWAGCDDESCEYVDCEDPIFVAWYVSILDPNVPIYLEIIDADGNVVEEEEVDFTDFNWVTPLCLEDGCYTALFSTAPDGQNANTYVNFSIDLDGDLIYDLWFDAVLDENGQAAFDFGINSDCSEPCEANMVDMLMFDSFGDGWNNAYYQIFGADSTDYVMGTLLEGDFGIDNLCLDDGCYEMYVGGGVFEEEITWELIWGDEVIASGGAPGWVTFGINSDCGNLYGCTDQEACNFDPNAVVDDQSCVYPGCMDPEALNYDPNAGCDGECEYAEPCDANLLTIWVSTQSFGGEIEWLLLHDNGDVVAEGGGYDSYSDNYQEVCLEDGCFILEMYDSFGDGWNGGFYMIYSGDGLVGEGTLAYGGYQLDVISLNSDCDVDGCTDPVAFNYNPDATLEDGSCLYSGGNFNFDPGMIASPVGLTASMSPNMVVDVAKVNLTNLNKTAGFEIMVVDLMGKLVLNESISNDVEYRQLEFDFGQLSNGLYFMTIRQENQVESLQFVVAR